MRRIFGLLLILTSIGGCEQQIRFGTQQTRSTIPQILEDQALANAVGAYYNKYALPAQISLKESLTTAQNGLNFGVAPNIALRAIAVTGLSLSTTNSLLENW